MTLHQTDRPAASDLTDRPAGGAIRSSKSVASLVAGSVRTGGSVLALLAILAVFSVLRPDTFPTVENARTILTLAAPLAVVACGLTVVLVMGDFDLSIGSMIGLGGAAAVVAQSQWHLTWVAAVALAFALAVVVGLVNGLLTAYAGLSSFILTLASGTILTGLEFTLTDQKTIYEGIDPGYAALGQASAGGLNAQVWIALGTGVVAWLGLRHTEAGRYAYAIGGNALAAALSGVRVSTLRVAGFVVCAVLATLAGVLLTAQANSSFSNAGQPYLLPTFAAVFLGTTIHARGQFNILGTLLGVLMLSVIQTGLTMMQLSTAEVNLAQGAVLLAAVLLSRLGHRS